MFLKWLCLCWVLAPCVYESFPVYQFAIAYGSLAMSIHDLQVLRACLTVQILKVGVLTVRIKTFALWRETQEIGVHSLCKGWGL